MEVGSCQEGEGAFGSWLQLLHRHQTVVKGPSGLPPVDRLLQFLVDSSGDGSEAVHCANCDLECNKQAGRAGGGLGPRVPGLTVLSSQCAPNMSLDHYPFGFSKI